MNRDPLNTTVYYQPQTKFSKVMFSQVFVCPLGGGGVSVQGEGSLSGGLCPGGSLSRGLYPRGVSVQGVSIQGGLCPRGSLSKGVSVQGGLCSRGVSVQGGVFVWETPPYGNVQAVRILLECILHIVRADSRTKLICGNEKG